MKNRKLTVMQFTVLSLLKEYGHHLIADATLKAWQNGQRYYVDRRVNLQRGMRMMFRTANKQVVNNL